MSNAYRVTAQTRFSVVMSHSRQVDSLVSRLRKRMRYVLLNHSNTDQSSNLRFIKDDLHIVTS